MPKRTRNSDETTTTTKETTISCKFTALAPENGEEEPVWIKEVKLRAADETHEVIFEPETSAVYVSQQTDSVLAKIKVDPETGLLENEQTFWRIGESHDEFVCVNGKPTNLKINAGLHNVSLSSNPEHKGCLWLSLQYANILLLVDVKNLDKNGAPKILNEYKVPVNLKDGFHVGGPHVIREDPQKPGEIWVGLKGAISCCPGLDSVAIDTGKAEPKASKPQCESKKGGGGACPIKASLAGVSAHARQVAKAMERNCCSVQYALEQFAHHQKLDRYECPEPNAWAVWHLKVTDYDVTKDDHGGKLYECEKSPPMLTIDKTSTVWVAQDSSPNVLRIDPTIKGAGAMTQIKIPFPTSQEEGFVTGPGIASSPDGSVWCALLSSASSMVQFKPPKFNGIDDPGLTMYDFGKPSWTVALNTIHMDFASFESPGQGKMHLLFTLSSSLLNHTAMDALIILKLDPEKHGGWTSVTGRRVVPLPTQDSMIHRVTVVRPDKEKPEGWSVVVTELNSSKLFQIKLIHLIDFDECTNVIDTVRRSNPKTTVVEEKADGEGKVTEAVCVEEFDHYAYTQHSLIMKPEHKGAGC